MDPDGRGVPIDSYLAGNFGQHTSGQIGYPACPSNTYDYGHQMAPNLMSLQNTCSTYTPLQNTGSSSLLYGSLPQHHTDLQYPCNSPQWPMVAPPEPHHQLFATLAGFPNGGVCDMPQAGSDDRGNLSGSDRPKRRRTATVAQRRAANVRERKRMFNLNEAFDELRTKVPTFPYEKKLSRIETLRIAITYIGFMTEVVSGRAPDEVVLGRKPESMRQLLAELTDGVDSADGEVDIDSDDDHDADRSL